MKYKFHLFSLLLIAFLTACSDDDNDTGISNEFVVAFENQNYSFTNSDTDREINLVFSEEASQSGTISITYTENGLIYGTDFSTTPQANSGIIEIPFEAGTTGTSFTFEKLTPNPIEGEELESVTFLIAEVTNGFSQGNTTFTANYFDAASTGGSLSPELGGPNQGNQVYVDLSTGTEKIVERDRWDLAFYSKDEFRVKLNSSMYMMAAALEETNIDNVVANDVVQLQNQMSFITEGSNAYVDHPNGNITETAIDEVSNTIEENKVYLINMGNEVGTGTPEVGSVAVAGDYRGWMKIRVLQENGEYVLQYADLEASTHQEVTIAKSPEYNFTFFSLVNETIVDVEPTQQNWDLVFTTFIEVEDLGGGQLTSYGYSDYVATNVLAETKAYRVNTSEVTYADFSIENLDEASFEIDQRTIGSSWRNTIPPNRYIFNNIFYVIEDPEGNLYKLRFTAMMNQNGVRGYPSFEYSLLN
ncbi:HmuY family protein [Mesonia mobilis]|uniref:HmuY family protein n=1 Tax=Mesonia mobilis TaxID=369791 RepID=UPI0026EE5A8D|nr:HmuY family protein [Mesonia mobilis]